MTSLALAILVVVAGTVVAVAGLCLSVWSSHRRRPSQQETGLRTDPGLVVAFIGAVALIFGSGTVVFLLLAPG